MSEMIVKFHCDERGISRSWDEVGELIRCKDCKYYYNTDPESIPTANIICSQMHEDDYCSYAERKEE